MWKKFLVGGLSLIALNSFAATLYWGGIDNNWYNTSNWFTDAGLTTPAGLVPTSSDDVILVSGTAPLADLDGAWQNPMSIDASVLLITFTGPTNPLNTTVTGNVLMTNYSKNDGTISGNVTFTDSAQNRGIINASSTIIFSSTAYNGIAGSITGDVEFNEDADGNYGSIDGNVIFEGLFTNSFGSVTGTKTRRYNSSVTVTADFVTDGPWIVVSNGSGTIVNVCGSTFDNTTLFSAQNSGIFSPSCGTLYWNGSDNDWFNSANWYSDAGLTIPAGAFPTSVYDVVLSAGTSPIVDLDNTSWGNPISINTGALLPTFSGSTNPLNTTVTGNVILTNYAKNDGIINGNVTLQDTAQNRGTIVGTNIFFSSGAYNGIAGSITGDVEFNEDADGNYGIINGDAIFEGEFTNSSGTVTGTKTRRYNSSVTVAVDFVTSGPWTVVANGLGTLVNVCLSTYDGTTTFSPQNSGAFDPCQTLYWNGSNSDWYSAANWFTDPGFATPASSFPGGSDFAIISAGISPIIDLSNPLWESPLSFDNTALIVEFTGSGNTGINIPGNAIFSGSSVNTGTVSGNATFNNSSHNGFLVSGEADFHDSSTNNLGATVANEATFDGTSINYGSVSSMGTFSGSSHNAGTIGGDAFFNGSSENDASATIVGNASFNGSSINAGYVSIDADFYDTSTNNGDIAGDADFYNSSTNGVAGYIQGNGIFHGENSQNNSSQSGSRVYRYFTSSITLDATWDFSSSPRAWTVYADGAGVNIDYCHSIFDSQTIFLGINGGAVAGCISGGSGGVILKKNVEIVPIKFSQIQSDPDSTASFVQFRTSKLAQTLVKYRELNASEFSSSSSYSTQFTSSHSHLLQDLKICTRYIYTLQARDESGSIGFSGENTFITTCPPPVPVPQIIPEQPKIHVVKPLVPVVPANNGGGDNAANNAQVNLNGGNVNNVIGAGAIPLDNLNNEDNASDENNLVLPAANENDDQNPSNTPGPTTDLFEVSDSSFFQVLTSPIQSAKQYAIKKYGAENVEKTLSTAKASLETTIQETVVVAKYSLGGVSALIAALFLSLNVLIFRTLFTTTSTIAGETLQSIATKYNMTERALIQHNPSLKYLLPSPSGNLAIGLSSAEISIPPNTHLKVRNRPFLEKDYLDQLKFVLQHFLESRHWVMATK